jgi:hypothetical protein
MAPVVRSHVFLGPLKAPQTAGEPSCEGESDPEIQNSDLERTMDEVVPFINESSLANSPQVEVQVITVQLPHLIMKMIYCLI